MFKSCLALEKSGALLSSKMFDVGWMGKKFESSVALHSSPPVWSAIICVEGRIKIDNCILDRW